MQFRWRHAPVVVAALFFAVAGVFASGTTYAQTKKEFEAQKKLDEALAKSEFKTCPYIDPKTKKVCRRKPKGTTEKKCTDIKS